MANEPELWESSEYVGAREESLFARDIDGQLIRATDATLADLQEEVKLVIDGEEISVMKAVPLRNSQGVILSNEDGELIPRPTTIYDAVQSYVKKSGKANPVPILCHREHLAPVGVCRVCLVEIEEKRASGRSKTALVSSCTYHVKSGMIINTAASPAKPKAVENIQRSTRMIVELLMSEHLSHDDLHRLSTSPDPDEQNELKRLAIAQVGLGQSTRFQPSALASSRPPDNSSEIIDIDRDACILCQRCTRACNEIKENHVISRTGKGYPTLISFDLNQSMAASSCVSCGECVISCPTDALTFKPSVVQRQIQKAKDQAQRGLESPLNTNRPLQYEVLTAKEMQSIDIFKNIPYRFLEFHAGACIRLVLPPDYTLCTIDNYESTAYLLIRGEFEVKLRDKPPERRTSDDLIVGEMSCLNHQPRSATVKTTTESEVIEIGRNVLYMLQRTESSREILNQAYRRHALNSALEGLPMFQIQDRQTMQSALKTIADKAELVSVVPGETIIKQGDVGSHVYLIRFGNVRVSRLLGAQEHVIGHIGSTNSERSSSMFGEIAVLSDLYGEELKSDFERLRSLTDGDYKPGIRTKTCSALDHVELVRIHRDVLKEITDASPELRSNLLNYARKLLDKDALGQNEFNTKLDNFVDQGLYNGQSLLVLDLESCTRCDECTKACADAHGGETRLVREGLRFENFLIATSCRSCTDPYCLVGCPVNSIFRKGTKEIVIEDHCIGCGQCATNCPYGNITMYSKHMGYRDEGGRQIPIVQQKATTCDQCKDIGGTPRCVYACPHDAAFRMTSSELSARVHAREHRARL